MATLYRAVDSAGETIEFMLSLKRDLIATKPFLRLALSSGGPSPRVINVDGHPTYPCAIHELKQSGELGRALSLPNRALSEQYHRAGSSFHQEADFGEPRLPFGGGRVANNPTL